MSNDAQQPRGDLSNGHDANTFPSVDALTQAFLRRYPYDAARKIEAMAPEQAVQILSLQPSGLRQRVWAHIPASSASHILLLCADEIALDLLHALDAGPCASLLSRFSQEQQAHYLSLMPEAQAYELRELMDYPPNCAGHMMDTRALAFSRDVSVEEVLKQLKLHPSSMRRRVYTLDADMRLQGQVNLEDLIVAPSAQRLREMSTPLTVYVSALDPKEEVAEKLEKNAIDILPVVDIHHRLLGVIRGASAIAAMKENLAADLQTMVGASADERALSSGLFAVRKRQGWLQINLLTGFLAAAVVGLFEHTIAQFTALAVLMPVAAGQSGNTGAQALAVTMRGLTLREITTRHWLRVTVKEAGAGLINGVAIAITCSLGVYVWSQSFGLALVIALSMVISMTIAGMAGALVPICLKKLGQDPAQSSSIILTTVTDIAGFLSFLGIATALSGMLS